MVLNKNTDGDAIWITRGICDNHKVNCYTANTFTAFIHVTLNIGQKML